MANFYLKPASSDIVQKLCKFIQVTDKTSPTLLSSHTHKKKDTYINIKFLWSKEGKKNSLENNTK